MATIMCCDCDSDFDLPDEERVWFEGKGFSIPKRCKECRVKKKAARLAEARF